MNWLSLCPAFESLSTNVKDYIQKVLRSPVYQLSSNISSISQCVLDRRPVLHQVTLSWSFTSSVILRIWFLTFSKENDFIFCFPWCQISPDAPSLYHSAWYWLRRRSCSTNCNSLLPTLVESHESQRDPTIDTSLFMDTECLIDTWLSCWILRYWWIIVILWRSRSRRERLWAVKEAFTKIHKFPRETSRESSQQVNRWNLSTWRSYDDDHHHDENEDEKEDDNEKWRWRWRWRW